MKRSLLFLVGLISCFSLMGQVPAGIDHQAIVSDQDGSPVANAPIDVQASIIEDAMDGSLAYSESHTIESDENGLIQFVIGQGNPLSGQFANIDWSKGPFFLKIDIDPGQGFFLTNTVELLAVPFAMHAGELGTYDEEDPVFNAWNKSEGILLIEDQITDLQNYLTEETQDLADVAGIGNEANARIVDLSDPVDDHDLTTKAYVDDLLDFLDARISALEDVLDGDPPAVSTAPVEDVTETSAVSGGNVTDDGGAPVTGRGIVWSTSENPAIDDHLGMTADGSGTGTFVSLLDGLDPETHYYVRAYATNVVGTSYGEQLEFTTLNDDDDDFGTVVDHDGNEYNTVIIGIQEWMASNLRVTTYNNGDPIPTGLDNSSWQNATSGAYAVYPHSDITGLDSDDDVLDAYGALYNWHAVNDARGICPDGWHVPSDAEWTQLTTYLVDNDDDISDSNTGNALKSCRQVNSPLGGDCATTVHPRWNSHTVHHGTDDYAFGVLPAGARMGFNGTFAMVGEHAFFWTSSEGAWEGNAELRDFGFSYGDVHDYGMFYTEGNSIRCVRNVE